MLQINLTGCKKTKIFRPLRYHNNISGICSIKSGGYSLFFDGYE